MNIGTTPQIILLAIIGSTLPLIASANPPRPDVTWELVKSRDNIRVERGVTDGSFSAFRGTGVVEASIGRVISILSDRERAFEWEYKLADAKVLRRTSDRLVVWQRTSIFFLPCLINDRVFIFVAEATFDEERKYVRALLRDISDTNIVLSESELSVIPDRRCSIKGTLIYTDWQFRPTGPESTCVRVEVLLRPNGKLKPKIMRGFEKKWPYSTIQGMRRQVLKDDIIPHQEFGGWVAASPETMITTEDCLQGILNSDGNNN